MERRTIRGVHFIRIKGSVIERAKAHALILKDEAAKGALPALAKKNEWILRRGPGIIQFKPVQDALVWFYRRILLKHLDRNNPEEIRAMMREMSKVSGIPYDVYMGSLFQADALMLFCRLSVMKHTLGDLPFGAMPACTSAVTLKNWTASGRLLACRNQDYPMVGPWEKNTTVIFNEPTDAGQIPHVGITSAGVHTAGLTSINREGLTLFTHAHFGRNVSLRGTSVCDIGNEIIRKAKSLNEAIDIASKLRPYANWAFIVSSAKENDAVVLEMTPKKMRVRHAQDGFLAHSNYFHSPELQKEEALMSGGCVDDLHARFCRIREILVPERGRLEPRHMAAALGDHVDFHSGEERVVGNTISVVTTIKSTVFDPESQKFWISSRHESPMGLGDFLEVDMDKFWSQPYEAADSERWPTLPGHKPKSPTLVEGMRHYREAYRAYHMENHLSDYRASTMISLRKAAFAFPSDGNLWLQSALVAFEMKEFKEARDCLEKARELKLSPHVSLVRDLYLARCMDLSGERDAALALYRNVAVTKDPKLGKAAARGLKRAYRAHEVASIMIDLQFADTFHY